MNNLRRMIHYLGTYKIDAVLGILIVAIETSIELFIPVLMARIIDEGIVHADIPLILHQGALMLACAVTSLAEPAPGGVREDPALRLWKPRPLPNVVVGHAHDHRYHRHSKRHGKRL